MSSLPFHGLLVTFSSAQLPRLTCQVGPFLHQKRMNLLLPLTLSLVVIICAVSCNHLMIGLRRVDGSLAQGVTEVEDSMAFAPRHSIDISTAFENADFARTRATDSETAWDVELSLRERAQSTRDTD